ncbi:MAG: DUF6879 family protein [Patescibacteria group bacterium]
MKTLPREKAHKLWDHYWSEMKVEWFKIEVLQDYTVEDNSPSLRAWLSGDKQTSITLLAADTRGWVEKLRQKHNQNVLMHRIRVIEKPYTPYTQWELECYKHNNIPSGEQVLVVEKREVKDLDLPSGDLMMFDNKRIAICAYDDIGRMIQQTFYDENDDITKFLQLKHSLLALARPL